MAIIIAVIIKTVVVERWWRDRGRGLVILNPIELRVRGRMTRRRESIVIQSRAVYARQRPIMVHLP